MEFKTKFNPTETVHFMFDNKAVTGEIINVQAYIGFDKQKNEPTVSIVYKVNHKWKAKTDPTATGFMASDPNREKTLDFYETSIFSSKEELLKSL